MSLSSNSSVTGFRPGSVSSTRSSQSDLDHPVTSKMESIISDLKTTNFDNISPARGKGIAFAQAVETCVNSVGGEVNVLPVKGTLHNLSQEIRSLVVPRGNKPVSPQNYAEAVKLSFVILESYGELNSVRMSSGTVGDAVAEGFKEPKEGHYKSFESGAGGYQIEVYDHPHEQYAKAMLNYLKAQMGKGDFEAAMKVQRHRVVDLHDIPNFPKHAGTRQQTQFQSYSRAGSVDRFGSRSIEDEGLEQTDFDRAVQGLNGALDEFEHPTGAPMPPGLTKEQAIFDSELLKLAQGMSNQDSETVDAVTAYLYEHGPGYTGDRGKLVQQIQSCLKDRILPSNSFVYRDQETDLGHFEEGKVSHTALIDPKEMRRAESVDDFRSGQLTVHLPLERHKSGASFLSQPSVVVGSHDNPETILLSNQRVDKALEVDSQEYDNRYDEEEFEDDEQSQYPVSLSKGASLSSLNESVAGKDDKF